jgi:hypothetical protein
MSPSSASLTESSLGSSFGDELLDELRLGEEEEEEDLDLDFDLGLEGGKAADVERWRQGWHLLRYFAVKTRIDASRYGPCNQSDTSRE